MPTTIKNERDIEGMRVAGRLASEVLDMLTPHVQPGVTTDHLDRLAHDLIVHGQGAIPAPLNYAPPGYTPYPKSICTSINHQVCHGIPNDRGLKSGDIVNIDVTVIKDGWHGDTSRMFIVGERLDRGQAAGRQAHVRRDVEGHREGASPACAWATSATRSRSSPKATASRSCASSAATASARASTRTRRCCTTASRGTLEELKPGMTFTIEPMINAGKRDIKEDSREARRRLDHRHARPLAVGAVGAHGAGHRNRLRGADALGRFAGRSPDFVTAPAGVAAPRRLTPAGAPIRAARHDRSASMSAVLSHPPSPSATPDTGTALARERFRDAKAQLLARFAEARPTAHAPRRRCCARWPRWWTARCSTSGATPAWTTALALVAVGGYGRGELFPYSDVDVLVLLPDATAADTADAAGAAVAGLRQAATEQFITACWDAGLEIGSSRCAASDECVEMATSDVTVQTALLEARFLGGEPSLYRAFAAAAAGAMDPKAFLRAKTLEMRQRHQKYENTPYSLEPNCKESPGGLRDLQTVIWVARAAGFGRGWQQLAAHGLITPFEVRQLQRNEGVLKLIRARLHLVAKRREDRLVFDLQTAVAESFGYRASNRAARVASG